jgi:tetratricopeptide (TPR) repeat protein
MTTASQTAAVLTPGDLAPVRELYNRGLCLQAYHAAEALGPLREWTGPDARVLTGRIAIHLGAPRLARWMHLRAYREVPTHPEATYYYTRAILDRRGPLAAWRFLRARGERLPGAFDEVQADWLAFHGCVLGRLRDFDAAEQWLGRAERLCPARPWLCVERSGLLEIEDRLEESLAAGRRALELRPWYRPGVQCVAHSLELLGRDREALELLYEGSERLESMLLLSQLGALQTELGHHADARRTYARVEELAVLMEKDGAQWLAARRSDAAYRDGDRAEAAAFARRVEGPLYARFAQELTREPFEGRRVLLDVGFVRQHHSTCVPATLTALSRYWGLPAKHLEVAGAICYDGTPDHRERAWAEEHVYVSREFAVTWDAARALLDRGVPFTLTTIEPGNAHMQAVIGYDTCRGSLLVRDPSVRQHVEYHADTWLERHRCTGPRGHAIVPVAEVHRLDGLTLPDADLYDRLYRIQRALTRYDRAAAGAEYEALRAAAPGHRLTLQAARVLAVADADPTALLASVEGLLKVFPDAPLYTLARWSCLRDLGRRDDRVALLEAARAREKGDPTFDRLLALELLPDARQHPRAIRLLRSAIRRRPYDEGNLATLAQLLWAQRRFEEALELYGFAACLDDKDEGLARDCFAASRHLKRTEETLRFLRRRFDRFGAKSSQPARTLYWALDAFERAPEALAVLDEALALRDDGELLVYAAQCRAENGDGARAEELLAAAAGRCPRVAWLRASANVAVLRGDRPHALELWRQVVEAEPTALDANRAVAQHLSEVEGLPAALAFLRAACDRFPHHFALHQLLSEWLRNEGYAAQEPVVRRIVAIDPADAWARRELAVVLTQQGRLDEAEAELDEARRREPDSPPYYCVLGGLRERQSRRDEAREAYGNAIRLSVDNDWAIGRLMDTAETLAERRDALALIEAELVRQVIFGDGLLAYQQHARRTLEPEELLASLRRAHAARPDLWHAWSALVRQLLQMDRADEAHRLALQATARFPLLPGLWIDLAETCRPKKDAEGETRALEKAVQIRPGWAVPVRRLGEVYQGAGRHAEARALFERGVALAPRDAVGHGYLADALWKGGEKEAAFDRVRGALWLDPGYEWAWDRLHEWSADLDRRADAEAFARELTVRRPDEARSWLKLAQTLTRDEDRDERLRALDEAVRLNPHLQEAHDLRAVLLWEAGRTDEAEAACHPPSWNGSPPIMLRGRLAWLKAQRGDVPAAVALMRATLAEDPNYFWGWSQIVDWLRDTGTAEEYRAAAENLARLAPKQAPSHGYLAEALARQDETDAALGHLETALQLDTQYEWGWDQKAQLLCEAGRHDEAEAACLPAAFGDAPPLLLRGRLAWVRARRGDVPGAIATMRVVLDGDPDYAWGWARMAEWLRDHGTSPEYIAACEQLVRLSPGWVASYGYRAEARSRNDDRAGAKDDCRKALEIDPKYNFAGDLLFDLQLEDGELDGAAATLALAQGSEESDGLLVRQVRLAARRGDRALALDRLGRLTARRPVNAWPISSAVKAFVDAGWSAAARKALAEAMANPEPAAGVAAQWVRLSADAGDWRCARRLKELLNRGAVGREALGAYVEALARHASRWRLWRCLRSFRAELRADDTLWGRAGYALLCVRHYAAARKWLGDWRAREGARPWMLYNAAIAFRAAGNHGEGNAVSHRALAVGGDDDVVHHRAWVAFDEALAGNAATAEKMLAELAPASLNRAHCFVRALARSLAAVQLAAPGSRAAAFAEARKKLADSARTCSPTAEARAVRPAYRAGVARLAGDLGGVRARLWAVWRWLFPLLPAAK